MPEIIEINDITIPELKPYTDTSELELKNSEIPMFIAESPKVIRVALDAGWQPMALLCERKHIEGDARDIIERLSSRVRSLLPLPSARPDPSLCLPLSVHKSPPR